MARDHRKLVAFQLCDELLIDVYRVTRAFPKEELFVLTAQLRRCALSTPSNIVEGCGCRYEKEFLQHLNRAFGSLRELGYQFDVAHRLGYMPDSDRERFDSLHNRASAALHALIKSIEQL